MIWTAIATHVLTDATASNDEVGRAWNQTLDAIHGLSVVTMAVATTASDIERECMEQFVYCLENPWQPAWNREVFGNKKGCRECYRICQRTNARWPEDKCPR